jgi:hypothetical protein
MTSSKSFTAKPNRIKKEYVDLHMHSTFSDGAFTVEELLYKAKNANLNTISITDHDNLDAYEAGLPLAQTLGINFVPGVEISAVYEGRDIHILGYFYDHTNLALHMEIREQSKRRQSRGKSILKKLKTLGINLSWEKVLAYSKHGVVGRPHIAMAMQKEEYVDSFAEAFQKYLGEGAEAYVEKKGISIEQTIALIRSAGGISVLAHPHRSGIDELIPQMAEWGLGGIETFCQSQKGVASKRYRDFAKKHDLVCSGGSDFHSDNGSCRLGGLKIPHSVIEQLQNKLEHQKADWL